MIPQSNRGDSNAQVLPGNRIAAHPVTAIIRPTTAATHRMEKWRRSEPGGKEWRGVRRIGLTLGVCGLAVLTGCGYTTDRTKVYRTSNTQKNPIRSVAVDVFGSREFRRGLELQLTEAVKKRINTDSPFRIANKDYADTILTGEIKEVRQATIGRDFQNAQPRETAQTVVVSFQWKDLRTGEVLVDRPNFVQTVDYIRPLNEDFYHASQRNMDKLAERIVEQMESDDW